MDVSYVMSCRWLDGMGNWQGISPGEGNGKVRQKLSLVDIAGKSLLIMTKCFLLYLSNLYIHFRVALSYKQVYHS